jgi:ABC-type transport system involved in cytochrome c biogenesis permease component
MTSAQLDLHANAPVAHAVAEAVPVARRRDERLFLLVLMLCFPLFLVGTIASHLASAGAEKQRGSVFAEAAANARAAIATAFTA